MSDQAFDDSASPLPEISFRRLIVLGIGTKFFIDTGYQLFHPYLAIFAAGLGVNIIIMGRLVSLMNMMGIMAPIMANIADRRGYRWVIRMALLLGAFGTFMLGSSRNLGVAIVGLMLMGIGFTTFVPMLHAYLSLKIPYHQRAKGIGIVEYAWALASIVGLSFIGQLITWTSWRVPLFLLAFGMVIGWLIFGTVPDIPSNKSGRHRLWPKQIRTYFDFGPNSASAWGSMAVFALNYFASLHIIIVHGVWLTEVYGLSASFLGVVALILGVADLCGSVLVSLASDHIGKRRSVLLGTSLSLLIYCLLPFVSLSLPMTIISLIIIRFAFEFSLVSSIPLISEQVPDQRAKILALNSVLSLLSATLVGITGPGAYTTYGLWGLGPVSAVVIVVSLFILWRWVREIQPDDQRES